MRAVLVTNPFATKTNDDLLHEIVTILSEVMQLTVHSTTSRENAMELGATYKKSEYDLVISLGGDGTANELINGLLCMPFDERPLFASLPGGNANVLARNLGFPANPVDATHELIRAATSADPITMGLGKVDALTRDGKEFSRYFAFNAGMGIDAEVILAMHELRNRGHRVSDMTYAMLAMRRIFSWIKKSTPHIDINGQKYFYAFIMNLSPWTYVAQRAINPAPQVTLHNSLSIFAARSAHASAFISVLRALALGKSFTSVADIDALENQTDITLHAFDPLWLQVDGEPLDLVQQTRFTHHPDMLRVFAAAHPGL